MPRESHGTPWFSRKLCREVMTLNIRAEGRWWRGISFWQRHIALWIAEEIRWLLRCYALLWMLRVRTFRRMGRMTPLRFFRFANCVTHDPIADDVSKCICSFGLWSRLSKSGVPGVSTTKHSTLTLPSSTWKLPQLTTITSGPFATSKRAQNVSPRWIQPERLVKLREKKQSQKQEGISFSLHCMHPGSDWPKLEASHLF